MKKLFFSFLISGTLMTGYANEGVNNSMSTALFANKSLTALKKNITAEEIGAINNVLLRDAAQRLNAGTYQLNERMRAYECYLSPFTLAKELKTSPYSQFENPTGIYFEDNDEAIVWVGKTRGAKIELVVNDWGKQEGRHSKTQRFELKEGVNRLKIEYRGNSYIAYFDEKKASKHKVEIHILGGKVNGVFALGKDDNQRWNKLLNNAVSPVMDVVGKQTQLIYSVSSLKREAPHQGVELIQLYDSIITQQHEIMGLVKYNKVPKNHMLGRVIWNGFMHADGLGAAFHDNTMTELANVDKLRKSNWGVAHEFGHVNQVRPNMKWVGTTEVSNNIYSVWSQYFFNSAEPKLERERLNDYDGPKIGGRITAYMESAFVHRQPWLTQAGNDRWERERPRDWGGDHFVKLVPFWQLQLYFKIAGEGNKWYNPDFYGKIFNRAIESKVEKRIDSYYQMEFIKNACDAAKLDLTDFFEQSGMLIPMNLWVDDYSCAQMTITPTMIKAVKEYASKYKKPSTPVLHYITANSVNIYKNKLALEGEKGKGFTKEAKQLVVDHNVWKNAVAFETYAGNKLVKIAFVGAGSNDVKTTIVHLPEGTTSVKAVAWDGTRMEVL